MSLVHRQFYRFWISLILASIVHVKTTSCMNAHVKVSHNSTNHPLPDFVNVTVTTDANTSTTFHLRRVKHINCSIPIYTISTDSSGQLVSRKEHLGNRQHIGYYQDLANEAVIEITRTNSLTEETANLTLEGEVRILTTKYTIKQEERVRRDVTATSSQGELYTLVPQPTPAVFNDYVVPPPEIKILLTKKETPIEVPSHIRFMPIVAESTTSDPLPPLSTSSASSSQSSSPLIRRRRQTVPTYSIDVTACIDYGAYRRFLTSANNNKLEALKTLQQYYAFVFSGVDLRYQGITSASYRLRVRLNKILITETAAASSFTETFRVAKVPWDQVDANKVLAAFSELVLGKSGIVVTPYDHAILFTGYDLYSTTSTGIAATTTGMAYTSTMCRTDGKSVSIVEDLGGLQCIDTAAHELGHGLGAKHDGDGNACSSADRYIMSSTSSLASDSNKYHPWQFSACSIQAFTETINNLIDSRSSACLTDALPISADLPDVSNLFPGQLYTPDQQCQMIYGNNSRYCRGENFGTASDICSVMYCYNPLTDNTCYSMTSAEGTTCGNGMLCVSGKCVSHPNAPAVDENCVFGDQPGYAFQSETCVQIVGRFGGYCYQGAVLERCCGSCSKIFRPLYNCEYGDKAGGCKAEDCSRYDSDTLNQCCGTCNHGTPYTTSRLTTTTTTPATTTTRKTSTVMSVVRADTSVARATAAPVVTTLASTTTTTKSICVDVEGTLVNNMTCQTAVRRVPSLCYEEKVYSFCCDSCQSINSGTKDCEYGDRYPERCQTVSCNQAATDCCRTCPFNASVRISVHVGFIIFLTIVTKLFISEPLLASVL